jgi:hypothetical protein
MPVKASIDNPQPTGRDGAIDHFIKLREAHEDSLGRLLYDSPNGDRWYLVRDSQGVGVIHAANAPSGGHAERVAVADFLRAGNGPEQQELMRLIGTLVENQ